MRVGLLFSLAWIARLTDPIFTSAATSRDAI